MTDVSEQTLTIDAEWVATASAADLRFILLEYRHLVHRFTQWLALAIGHADHERVRQLLLPNLVEELGGDVEPSHAALLDACIRGCGADPEAPGPATASTREVERWFFETLAGRDTHASLCVLGPATEAASFQFLDPLEAGLRRSFGDALDYTYFDVHRPEVEDEHAQALEDALAIVEKSLGLQDGEVEQRRAHWVSEGLNAHQRFWDGLRSAR